jgi:two-component system, NtrC family, sensor histidine kinase HydH
MGRAHLDLRLRFAVTGVAGTMLLAAALVVGLNSFLTRAVLHREATATQAFLQSIVGYDSDGLRTDTGGGLMSELIAHIRTIPQVLRANLYGTDGRIMWSTDQDMTGRRFDNPDLEKALAGQLVSEFGTLEEVEKAEHVGLAAPKAGRFVEAYLPMWRGADIVYVVELYKTPIALETTIGRIFRFIAGSAVLVGMLPVASLYWIVRRGARQIAQQQADLHRMASLAGIGQAVGALAHGLRHPLAAIRQMAERLPIAHPADASAPNRIAAGVDRLDRYAREVASVAQSRIATFQPVDPFFLVRGAVSRQRVALRSVRVEVAIDDQRSARHLVDVDPPMLVQAMASILAETSRGGGTLRIVLSEPDSRHTCIEFVAEGRAEPTVPADTDRLGLTLARSMIERSNGRLDILSLAESAATLRITLRVGA